VDTITDWLIFSDIIKLFPTSPELAPMILVAYSRMLELLIKTSPLLNLTISMLMSIKITLVMERNKTENFADLSSLN